MVLHLNFGQQKMAANFQRLSQIEAELDYEFEKLLVAAVKSFRCLYATDDPDYYNTQQNKTAWLKISERLNKPVTECMNKWYGLLQVFLYHHKFELSNTPRNRSVWIHYDELKDLQPYIQENYSQLIETQLSSVFSKPTAAQNYVLLCELTNRRTKLLTNETTTEERQLIWQQIADKLNAIQYGVRMPVLMWMKYWWDLKQNVGVKRFRIQMKLQELAANIKLAKYSDEDRKILKFCGVTSIDNTTSITEALNNNAELGIDKDIVIRKCKKCTIILNELVTQDFCETCRKIPKTICDICSKPNKEGVQIYNVNNWSSTAKNLLPLIFNLYNELSICTTCSNDLKKQAATVWRACRICGCNPLMLDNLFSTPNESLRNVFKDATKISFSEFDGLPGYICKVCKVQMQQFNNFYLRFCRAQCRLQEIHVEQFIGSLPCKPEQSNSIVSSNKVMILKPDDNLKTDINSTQPKYTLTAKFGPEHSGTSINTTGTTTTKPVYMLPPANGSPNSVYSKPTGVKRVFKLQPGCVKRTIVVSASGPTTAKQSYTVKTVSAGVIATSSTSTAVGNRIYTGPKVTTKGLLALIPGNTTVTAKNPNTKCKVQGPAPVVPITTNTVTKRICVAPMSLKRIPSPIQQAPSSMSQPFTITGARLTKQISATPSTGVPFPFQQATTTTTQASTTIGARIAKETSVAPSTGVPFPSQQTPISSSQTFTNTGVRVANQIPAAASPGSNIIATSTKRSAALSPSPARLSPSNIGPPNAKRIRASHPAVFTIPGEICEHQKQQDSFCKPNPGAPLPNSYPMAAPEVPNSEKINIAPNSVSPILQTIKEEVISDSYPETPVQTATICSNPGFPNLNGTPARIDSEISSNASTLSVESPNNSANQHNISKKNIKLSRLDGSTVVLKSNPSISSSKCHVIQPRKIPNGRAPSKLDETSFSRKIIAVRKMITDEQQRQQELQQPITASGSKKPRKYWGAVDEFQISSVSDRAQFKAHPIQKRRMAAESPKTTNYSPVNKVSLVEELPNETVVKKEENSDKDDDVLLVKTELNPSMIYPDSFELENVTLSADVSLMINDMMAKQQGIVDTSLKLDTESFKYINPSFLVSYAQNQDVSTKEDSEEKDKPKEKILKQNTLELCVKPSISIRIKKLRIRLKRCDRVGKIIPRLKSSSLQPTQRIITRRSLRQNKSL